jgi:hypothetical protein
VLQRNLLGPEMRCTHSQKHWIQYA